MTLGKGYDSLIVLTTFPLRVATTSAFVRKSMTNAFCGEQTLIGS